MRWNCAFKYFALLVLPVYLLDGCLNRDPLISIDERYRLIAVSGTSPLALQELPIRRGDSPVGLRRPDIHHVDEFRLNDAILTGKHSKGYFIVARATGEQSFYTTLEERNAALRMQFHTSENDLKELPFTAFLRGNPFYPYNLIYYVCVTVCIVGYCRWKRRRVEAP